MNMNLTRYALHIGPGEPGMVENICGAWVEYEEAQDRILQLERLLYLRRNVGNAAYEEQVRAALDASGSNQTGEPPMQYPARFEVAPEGGFVITFRDIPEAITQADTVDEAHQMAADALLTAMDFYFEDVRTVPEPSQAREGEELVSLPAPIVAKVLMLNELVRQKLVRQKKP